ncbi:MAG: hypothetical protein ACRD8Z_00375 [Nitrososphaeraceae archaeon]
MMLEVPLLIYLIGASVGPVIAGTFMQANQVIVKSETGNISFPSLESYDITFLTTVLIAVSSIAFAFLPFRNAKSQDGHAEETSIPNR